MYTYIWVTKEPFFHVTKHISHRRKHTSQVRVTLVFLQDPLGGVVVFSPKEPALSLLSVNLLFIVMVLCKGPNQTIARVSN